MKKILKQFIVTSQNGKVLKRNTERLTDNGRGRLNLTTRSTAIQCPISTASKVMEKILEGAKI